MLLFIILLKLFIMAYLSICCCTRAGKRLFDRSLADVDLECFPFASVLMSLTYLFKDCTVIIECSVPKTV